MKIVFFGNATSIHVQRWATWFAKRGHEVHVFTCVDGKIEDVDVHHINIKLKHLPFAQQVSLPLERGRIRRTIREINPDIVHGHFLISYGLYAACSGFHPLVLSAWGSDVLIDPERYTFLKLLAKYALRKADLITCAGENLLERVVELGANLEKIKVIYFGVDTQKFRPLPANRSLRKKELGLFDPPTIISIRALKPIYDIETLIKAIPSVLEKVPEAKFIIAGDGDQRDYLKNLATSLGVSRSIKFVGWIAHDDLPKYLASSDVYVSTSLSDGMSNSTLEAMACELAVAVTDSGEHRNWIKDGVNGFVVPMRSPEVLASKIIYLLEHEDDRVRFGKANRPIVEQKACYKTEGEKLEKLYEELISKKKSTSKAMKSS